MAKKTLPQTPNDCSKFVPENPPRKKLRRIELLKNKGAVSGKTPRKKTHSISPYIAHRNTKQAPPHVRPRARIRKPRAKKLGQRTLKKRQTDGGIPRNTVPQKNEQHFPLCPQRLQRISWGRGGGRVFVPFVRVSNPVRLAGLEGRRKKRRKEKETWGGDKNVRVRKGPKGAEKMPLSQTNGPGRRASEGPCDPLADKIRRQNPRTGGGQPSALDRASPGPHLGEGVGAITRGRPPRDHGAGLLEKV